MAFAGIDLKITPDSQVYCFEVNPSPAFSYYEAGTGQQISEAVARYLAGKVYDKAVEYDLNSSYGRDFAGSAPPAGHVCGKPLFEPRISTD